MQVCCILICICMQNHNDDTITTSGHSSFRKIYLSLYWRGCVCEGVGDRTKTATYWPNNSYGYHSLSFPFSWTAQPGAWGPCLCFDMVLIPPSYLQLIWTSRRRGYIIIWRPLFFLRALQFRTQFNSLTVKVTPDLLISSTGCTCYSHRCISSFDILAGSEVNMQQADSVVPVRTVY